MNERDAATRAVASGLRPVIFTFGFSDEDHGSLGFTDGSEWNGFLNVRVLPSERDAIEAHFRANHLLDHPDDFAVAVGPDGLVDLSGGFATSEAEWGSDAHVETENRVAEAAGHPEGCLYTSKATTEEILAHVLTRDPDCDGFVR